MMHLQMSLVSYDLVAGKAPLTYLHHIYRCRGKPPAVSTTAEVCPGSRDSRTGPKYRWQTDRAEAVLLERRDRRTDSRRHTSWRQFSVTSGSESCKTVLSLNKSFVLLQLWLWFYLTGEKNLMQCRWILDEQKAWSHSKHLTICIIYKAAHVKNEN